jgi:hypothetical protein
LEDVNVAATAHRHGIRPDRAPRRLLSPWQTASWHASGRPADTFGGVKLLMALTATASIVARVFHERTPVLIASADFVAWLDPRTPAADLHTLLRPYPAEAMEAVPVGHYVGNPRNEGPRCLAPGRKPDLAACASPCRRASPATGRLFLDGVRGAICFKGRGSGRMRATGKAGLIPRPGAGQ